MGTPPDQYLLQRFVDAQQPVYAVVRSELAAGAKRTHWMWFTFPQVAGLGHSAMARRFSITGLPEAAAYLHHPVLGERLMECTRLVLQAQDRPLQAILGYPDDLKFHSSMTLFALAAKPGSVFHQAIAHFFEGRADQATLALLQRSKPVACDSLNQGPLPDARH